MKIESFEQLNVWQEAQNLAVIIYAATQNFPKEELFGLTSQMKRSSSSISANIAEGFGRRTINDKLQFYIIAYGSLLETKNFVYLAQRLSYIPDKLAQKLLNQIVTCQKQLNASMRSMQ